MAIIRVPYGLDGAPLDITPPAGYTKVLDCPPNLFHNSSESSVLMTDEVEGDLLERAIFSDDGSSFDGRDIDYLATFVSGTDNVWIKWHETECKIICLAVYDIDKVLTESEYAIFVSYFTQGSCGGGVVPFPT